MPYDPTLYRGCAVYYTRGRPPYSRALASTLATELDLDGRGRFLDIGCGPGKLTIELANHFEEAIGLDPEAEMLAAAADRATAANNIRWVKSLAEDIPELNLGMFRLATCGSSFHWTERERVAEAVFEVLEPGGALALIEHAHEGRPRPAGPGYPPIPHDAIRELLERYLGTRRRAGQGYFSECADRHDDALTRTRFGRPRRIFCEGRADIVQDIDGVLANYLSTSFAAPHLFGERLPMFEAEFRAELAARSPSGLFWD
ncbi:MAG: class I SAM-dependent methyltransferase, partial [Blastocatellia bacterium]|nr:class I SAM-dependent methyltransferase [Blastocatellia bacterium]